jgi:hypothetical protein
MRPLRPTQNRRPATRHHRYYIFKYHRGRLAANSAMSMASGNYSPSTSVEEDNPQMRFQISHLFTQIWLRGVTVIRGLAKTLAIHHRDEIMQLSCIHKILLIRIRQ